MAQQHLAKRIEALEKQNRRLWSIGSMAILLIGLLAFSVNLLSDIAAAANSNFLPFAETLGREPNEALTLLFCIAAVAIFAYVARLAARHNPHVGKLSMDTRMLIAREAVEKLTQARRLLKEGDQNLEAAQRLRNRAVKEDLPAAKVVIRGQDPRSLLLDVDRRIEAARSRRYVKESNKLRQAEKQLEAQIHTQLGESSAGSGTRIVEERIRNRLIGQMASPPPAAESKSMESLRRRGRELRSRERRTLAFGVTAIAVAVLGAAWLLSNVKGGVVFSSAFSFLK